MKTKRNTEGEFGAVFTHWIDYIEYIQITDCTIRAEYYNCKNIAKNITGRESADGRDSANDAENVA